MVVGACPAQGFGCKDLTQAAFASAPRGAIHAAVSTVVLNSYAGLRNAYSPRYGM